MKKLFLILAMVPTLCVAGQIEFYEGYFKTQNENVRLVANSIFEKHEKMAMEKYPDDACLRSIYIAIKFQNFTNCDYR